jgi:hypothetical protein
MISLKRMLILVCLFFIGVPLLGQATLASGSVASGSGGTVNYSVGQIVYTKNVGPGGSVSQGVQQPYEISVTTSIKGVESISLDFTVFPNPASDFIRLRTATSELKNLRYELYNFSGNILLSNKIENTETNISMQNFLPGNYFLKISGASVELKTFKIIKR